MKTTRSTSRGLSAALGANMRRDAGSPGKTAWSIGFVIRFAVTGHQGCVTKPQW
ncbi:MAG: hypothetical protein HPY69_05545 [Armatimonadetes bacterium]|nr:hypothetical protein [Armatimonadota bacterium]